MLYFYPKDLTCGCTSQACNFRDLYPQIREKGAVVLSASKDSVESRKRFEEAHITLIMDIYFLHFAVSKRPFLMQKNEERRRADGV